jgi:hypothetical protein
MATLPTRGFPCGFNIRRSVHCYEVTARAHLRRRCYRASAPPVHRTHAAGAAVLGNRPQAKVLKIVAFVSISACGAVGLCMQVLGRRVPALQSVRRGCFLRLLLL